MKDPRRVKGKCSDKAGISGDGRRSFVKCAATVAATIAAIPLEPIINNESVVKAANANSSSAIRTNESFKYRIRMAQAEKIDVGPQPDNGDIERFTDFSGNYSKALPHDSLGVPNSVAYASLRNAVVSGNAADFADIIVGTPGGGGNSKLNGPQGAMAFDLEGLDSHSTVIPAAPSVASAQTAAEQVEHYWGALLADVPFTDYTTNPLAAQAAADMNNLSFLKSSASNQFPYPVTPQNLFRGQFIQGDGNVQGPYVSQFMIQPTFLGVQPLPQRYQTFLPVNGGGNNYLTTVSEYLLVQNGGDSGRRVEFDPVLRYVRNGRDLAAYTRVDVLYQAYFVALLVLTGLGTAPNPGSPYIGSGNQKSFGTFGGPDAAGTLTEMATRALKASWFHKWVKDLRMRPEEYGALVHARKTGTSTPQAAASLHSDVLNSGVLPIINSKYGTYLLPQAFPEGSPTHPCYPTGHGTVGGACITALKFFVD